MVNPLVEALLNVRSGRLALKAGVVSAAKYHLALARYWLQRERVFARFVGRPTERRCDRVLGWINKYAVEVVAAETEVRL